MKENNKHDIYIYMYFKKYIFQNQEVIGKKQRKGQRTQIFFSRTGNSLQFTITNKRKDCFLLDFIHITT